MKMLLKVKYLLLATLYFTTIILSCKEPEYPQTIPEFSMRLADTTKVFHSREIPFGKPTIILWFDPACRDCQEETEYILANMQRFSQTDIYMVTKHPYNELMIFYNYLRLDTCKNIRVGIDESSSIPKAFKIRSTPITLVYSRDKMLIAVFTGKPKPEKLLSVIEKNI